MSNPKITVVIPTRERCDVLEYALRTATSQNYEHLEILVSDNCSGDDTAGVVQRANDRRIRYINPGRRLSMSHHWDFALEHVQDGWVTFVGDDDGLLPNSVRRIANIILQTDAKVIRTENCMFVWPGMPEHPNGQLIVPMAHGLERRSSAQWLQKVLAGMARYSQLPMIYNGGFIHRTVLEQIRSPAGTVFSSVNPDVYTAIAIARSIESYVYVREPLAIGGTSRHSNGHSAFSVSATRNKEAFQQFQSEGNIPFHADMPTMSDGSLPLSLQACVYEAYLQSGTVGCGMAEMNHQRQLAVILATAGKHRKSIEDWGRLFANRHGIDYPAAHRAAARLRPWLQGGEFSQKLKRAFGSVVTDKLPLSNIHDASIAAAVIRSKPGRTDSLRFLANESLKALGVRPGA